MNNTIVKAHKRKGTKGVKRHSRTLSKKKKVPHTTKYRFKRKAVKDEVFEGATTVYLDMFDKKTGEKIGDVIFVHYPDNLTSIDFLTINRKYQNKGYGNIMMKEALKEVDSLNNKAIVRVSPDTEDLTDPLIRFYKRHGFKLEKDEYRLSGGEPIREIDMIRE